MRSRVLTHDELPEAYRQRMLDAMRDGRDRDRLNEAARKRERRRRLRIEHARKRARRA